MAHSHINGEVEPTRLSYQERRQRRDKAGGMRTVAGSQWCMLVLPTDVALEPFATRPLETDRCPCASGHRDGWWTVGARRQLETMLDWTLGTVCTFAARTATQEIRTALVTGSPVLVQGPRSARWSGAQRERLSDVVE